MPKYDVEKAAKEFVKKLEEGYFTIDRPPHTETEEDYCENKEERDTEALKEFCKTKTFRDFMNGGR